jgi:hypothetical protein
MSDVEHIFGAENLTYYRCGMAYINVVVAKALSTLWPNFQFDNQNLVNLKHTLLWTFDDALKTSSIDPKRVRLNAMVALLAAN